MAKLQKRKTVSWAPDENLCQVRLFLSEDAPSLCGLGIQGHLQAKSSWLLHSTGMNSDDQPPPGFEGSRPLQPQIVMKWKCPPRLIPNPDWLVVAGEESKEAEYQNQRVCRVLEAVYPRPSAIPPSPSDPPELHQYHYDDNQTPLIPISPAEDDGAADPLNLVGPIHGSEKSQLSCVPKNLATTETTPLLTSNSVVEQSQGNAANVPIPHPNEKPAIKVIPGVEPDIVAAASAAFTAIMRSNEEGSLIDQDLLIKILGNPKLLEQLVSDYGMPANQQNMLKRSLNPITVPASRPAHVKTVGSDAPLSIPASGQFFPPTITTLATLKSRPAPVAVPISSSTPMKAPVKDINYYKSLVRQHGEERNDAKDNGIVRCGNHCNPIPLFTNLEPLECLKPRELKPKIQKPCIHFNSPSGCRHGANCIFWHDVSFQKRIRSMPLAQGAKRIKLDRELTGRS